MYEDGFVIMHHVVEPGDLAQLSEQIHRFFRRLPDLPENFRKELGTSVGGAIELNHVGALIPNLYMTSPLQDIAARIVKLLGHDIRFTFANAILKPAFYGETVQPHQDCAYDAASSAAEGYTVWLPFAEAGPVQGAIYYLPGSHRDGPRQHRLVSGVWSVDIADTSQTVSVRVPLGGIAMHSARTVHGSHQNFSDQPRLALSLRLRPG
ncbi:MAG: phytanoyl-CoA dioxygenase family protein [Rhodobacter sp.]|nr:phytanoyl-CoA dioxygenase family protein [Rhodobacter sp.]